MVEKAKGATPEAVAKAEEPKAEDKQPEEKPKAVSDTEELRSQIEGVKEQLKTAEDEAKAHKRNVTKKDLRVKELEQELSQLRDLADRVAILEASGLSGEDDEEKPKPKPKVSQPGVDNYARERVRELQERIIDADLDPNDPKFAPAARAAARGDWYSADKVVNEIIAQKEKPKVSEENKEDQEKKVSEMVEKRLREELEKRNLLEPEGTTPSGASGGITPEKIKTMSREERYEHRKEIDDMPLGI